MQRWREQKDNIGRETWRLKTWDSVNGKEVIEKERLFNCHDWLRWKHYCLLQMLVEWYSSSVEIIWKLRTITSFTICYYQDIRQMGYKLTGIFITYLLFFYYLYKKLFSHWVYFLSIIFLSLLNCIYLQNDIYLQSDTLFHPQVTFLWRPVQTCGKDLLDRLEETKEKHATDVDFLVAVTMVLKDWHRIFRFFCPLGSNIKKLAQLQHTYFHLH